MYNYTIEAQLHSSMQIDLYNVAIKCTNYEQI